MRRTAGFVFLFTVLILSAAPIAGQTADLQNLAEKLGYPHGAKVLMIHADDLAVAHSVNQATFDALDRGAATSSSIMVPCSWFPEVTAYAKNHPNADLGIHITMTSEWDNYRWGPVAPDDVVTSLLDPNGYLWPTSEGAAAQIKPEEGEREIRAQIDKASQLGIKVTHLDSHMGTVFNLRLLPVYISVAREYHVPFFMVKVPNMPPGVFELLKDDDLVVDSFVMADPSVKAEDWAGYYERVVRNLKPGVTVLIVHLGYDDSELRGAMTEKAPYGSAWRQRDYNVITSSRFAGLLKDNNVTLAGWKDLAKRAGNR